MSRAYRIAVSGSLERIVHIEDGVCSTLELLPILARERMREILGAELVGRGFVAQEGVARRDESGGVTVEVDLETGNVTVRVAAETELKLSGERSGHVYEEQRVEAGREALQKNLDQALEKQATEAQEKMRRQATAHLEARLKDLRQELDQVVNRVTAEALKEKARQMGEIEELLEDPETGALTIKVRV
jgi:hypothetical protein